MDFDLRIGQSQALGLTITVQAVQALKILQYSQQQLDDFLAEQMKANPLLKSGARNPGGGAREPSFSRSSAPTEWRDLLNVVARPTTLRDHLLRQVPLVFAKGDDRRIAVAMVEMIDADGYFRHNLANADIELGVCESAATRFLEKIQTFEPTGVGARHLAECLSLQLAERGQLSDTMRVLLDNLELLADYRTDRLASKCGIGQDELKAMVAQIRQLSPAPGRQFDQEEALPVLPEVLVRRTDDGGLAVTLNPDLLPRVLLDRSYYAEIKGCKFDDEGRKFVVDCYKSARWLTRALDQRAQTLLKVAAEVVSQQKDFFEHGVSHLKPLDLKTVAAAVGVHVSTVCRAAANKYIMTDRGVFEMKYFFSTALRAENDAGAVSAQSIQHRIRALVRAESDPLSDDAIVRILKGDGVEVARRTVAKYRMVMNIPGSSTRHRQKSMSLAQ